MARQTDYLQCDSCFKKRMHTSIKNELLHELTTNVLPYWMNKMTDNQHGGFYGRRDGHDNLDKESPKGIILNTRILWTFSAAVKVLQDHVYLETAHRAFEYIMNCFLDKEHGGVYWMVDYKGEPLQTKKQIYAQAFAIYAFTEYFLVSRNEDSLHEAKKLFYLIEQHSFDSSENGYLEAFDRQWNLLDDLRLSEKDANEKKTMNTHLHVLEAYTNLYRVWKDPALEKQLKNLIIVFRDKIVNKNFHFDLFFNEHWQVQSREISFGHDIEGSWLMHEAAEVLGDKRLLHEMERLAVTMADTSLREGLDADGGLMNEAGPDGHKDTDKHWWPQAEAIVGYVNAWQLTGDTRYMEKAEKVWSFVKQHLIDSKNGEWFWRTDRTGVVNFQEDKAGPWKCPYHNGRAALEIVSRLK